MIDKTDYTSMRLTTLTALILPCINYVSLVTLELLDLLKSGYFTDRLTVREPIKNVSADFFR